ncbi:hypothetical protein FPQ18DRAFT_381042 [Pyronema domesticum]|nr:hypothetical protein FPQ18DRAFT_381042 [Pyronema domesticum]
MEYSEIPGGRHIRGVIDRSVIGGTRLVRNFHREKALCEDDRGIYSSIEGFTSITVLIRISALARVTYGTHRRDKLSMTRQHYGLLLHSLCGYIITNIDTVGSATLSSFPDDLFVVLHRRRKTGFRAEVCRLHTNVCSTSPAPLVIYFEYPMPGWYLWVHRESRETLDIYTAEGTIVCRDPTRSSRYLILHTSSSSRVLGLLCCV